MTNRMIANANVVFRKVDNNIYEVYKDRNGTFEDFVLDQTVVRSLNQEGIKVMVVDHRLVLLTSNFSLDEETI